MIPILSILVVLTLSMLVTRVASVALVHTGISQDMARFQARSAFTGVGFTTTESESIVTHPVRRRIVATLMLVGNLGFVTALSSLILSFLSLGEGYPVALQVGTLAGGLALLWILASSRFVDRHLCHAISWALERFTQVDTRDYSALLHPREEYGVSELSLDENDWLSHRNLRETRLGDEGLLVLGVECPGGNFIGAPGPDVELRPGDRLILYGRESRIAELDARTPGVEGDLAHRSAAVDQHERSERETAAAGRA